MPMVKYWMSKDSVMAKVMKNKEGALVMKMEGEDELFPGFPRSHTLFGTLSKLKHEVKNQVFNDSWWALEKGESVEKVIGNIKKLIVEGVKVRDNSPINGIRFKKGEDCLGICKYDMLPPQRMVAPVREVWRVLEKMQEKEPKLEWLKEFVTFILMEDDAVRFRFQWIVQIMRPRWWKNPVKWLDLALKELENAEVVRDMKFKIQLLRRIWLLVLKDKKIMGLWKEFCKEADWKKLELTKADKYHLRGKYFKCDFDKFEY